MEILNKILNRISGKLERQFDLQITNKTIILTKMKSRKTMILAALIKE